MQFTTKPLLLSCIAAVVFSSLIQDVEAMYKNKGGRPQKYPNVDPDPNHKSQYKRAGSNSPVDESVRNYNIQGQAGASQSNESANNKSYQSASQSSKSAAEIQRENLIDQDVQKYVYLGSKTDLNNST